MHGNVMITLFRYRCLLSTPGGLYEVQPEVMEIYPYTLLKITFKKTRTNSRTFQNYTTPIHSETRLPNLRGQTISVFLALRQQKALPSQLKHKTTKHNPRKT